MFEISKDIPRPQKKYPKYPFAKMKRGDSFIIRETYTRYEMQAALGAANAWNTKCNSKRWKFSVKKVLEDGKNQIRIWRIK